ncbi:hypothetical protein ACNF40_04740 [Cuniculiplasma sp. SKW4]
MSEYIDAHPLMECMKTISRFIACRSHGPYGKVKRVGFDIELPD